ncbi:MAG: ion channel [Caulobacterales bacterium]|jgi:voltage-gated potassium channel
MTSNGQPATLRSNLRELYFGATQRALRFQAALVVLDIIVIGFFVFSQFVPEGPWLFAIDYAIAVFLAIDLSAKLYALGSARRWLKYPTTWVDLVVLATLLFPALLHNWGFLRILRLWTLVHRERFWNVLGAGQWNDTYAEDLTKAIVNLIVFVFLAAGVAQALFLGDHPKLNNFLDAVYFVVTALTTTGFGDITIDTAAGRIFSIVLMLTGITLFFGIAQRAFAPQQKFVACVACGQERHERDARFCRACGTELPIAIGRGPNRARHHHDN